MKANIITRIAGGILCLSVLLSVLCVNAASVMAGGIGAAEALEDTAAVTKAVTAPAVPYYGRDQLTSMANATALLYAYDQIVAGVEASADTISVYNGTDALTKDELSMVVDVYRRDYAHHFWLGNSYQISLIPQTVLEVIPTYLLAGADLTAAKEAFEQRVTQVLSGVTGSMSEYEKELYLHDTLAGMISYVEDTHAHNAYGALVEGKAVCEGYAEALQYLLQRVGIQSFLAIGASINPGTNAAENHEWNYVRIDGKYYHTDLTWDDQDDELYHAYFNQSDAVMLEDHALTAVAYTLPRCDATDAQYFTGKATYLTTYTAKTVGRLLKDNGLSVHLYIPGSVNDFISWCYTNIRDVSAEAGVTGGFTYGYSRLGREVVFEIHPSCDHVPADTWSCDGQYHWKVCSVDGCGAMIPDTKGRHQPDHLGGASAEYAVKCEICQYVIHEQLDHTHVFDQKVATDAYKASDATCQKKALYYTSCTCGQRGTETFAHGALAGHSYGDWFEYQAPTTTAVGEERRNCQNCDHFESRELPKLILSGWVQENGKWCYFENRKKVTNKWLLDSVGWCFVGDDGYCVTSCWKADSKGWCYLDENGRMATNRWVRDSVGWCYVGADGYAVTNCWKRDSVGWCYLNSNGSMTKSAWVKDGGKWYYLDANGYMVTNAWRKDSKGWVYVGSDGAMMTNAWVRDSIGWCYVGADGYAVTNCWKKDSVGWCYLNSNGSMTKNAWLQDGGEWYYLDGNGYMVSGKTITIGGKKYTFNASGVWVSR
ncbi:MAG: hypothetical protein IJC33_06895 [Clostridia bacterium]|nr:hypothetical protein [Clostridia bacterium]